MAEVAATEFLRSKGCQIVAQNWRTRRCEIDVVATKGRRAYCCEVKYRSSSRQGAGLDYITSAKLQQMHFAAETWAQQSGWPYEYQLCAIEVSGPKFRISRVVLDF